MWTDETTVVEWLQILPPAELSATWRAVIEAWALTKGLDAAREALELGDRPVGDDAWGRLRVPFDPEGRSHQNGVSYSRQAAVSLTFPAEPIPQWVRHQRRMPVGITGRLAYVERSRSTLRGVERAAAKRVSDADDDWKAGWSRGKAPAAKVASVAKPGLIGSDREPGFGRWHYPIAKGWDRYRPSITGAELEKALAAPVSLQSPALAAVQRELRAEFYRRTAPTLAAAA
jgi:hypothetical protein